MYNYIPLLLWGAGRLIVKEINKRNSSISQSVAADLKRSRAAAPPSPNTLDDPRRLQEIEYYGSNSFSMAVGLMAKLAKVDGVLSQAEVRAVEGIFVDLGLTDEVGAQAVSVFQTAKDGVLTYSDLLGTFALHTRDCPQVRQDLVLMLLRVAHADSDDPPRRVTNLIHDACMVLGLDYQQHFAVFQAWRQAAEATRQAGADQVRLAYEILGCSPADGAEHLRHRYRQLVRDFHPDTIAGKGLSPEFTRFAEEKFKQIQAAYDLLAERHR